MLAGRSLDNINRSFMKHKESFKKLIFLEISNEITRIFKPCFFKNSGSFVFTITVISKYLDKALRWHNKNVLIANSTVATKKILGFLCITRIYLFHI
jgi:hypothetical protein